MIPQNNHDYALLVWADFLEDQGIDTAELREEIATGGPTNTWMYEYKSGGIAAGVGGGTDVVGGGGVGGGTDVVVVGGGRVGVGGGVVGGGVVGGVGVGGGVGGQPKRN